MPCPTLGSLSRGKTSAGVKGSAWRGDEPGEETDEARPGEDEGDDDPPKDRDAGIAAEDEAVRKGARPGPHPGEDPATDGPRHPQTPSAAALERSSSPEAPPRSSIAMIEDLSVSSDGKGAKKNRGASVTTPAADPTLAPTPVAKRCPLVEELSKAPNDAPELGYATAHDCTQKRNNKETNKRHKQRPET